jgi:hypothetical protein
MTMVRDGRMVEHRPLRDQAAKARQLGVNIGA